MSTNHIDGSAPIPVDNVTLQFPSCTINVEAFGCIHNACEIAKAWVKLVEVEFPLNKILPMLKVDEPLEIVRIVDALECCRSINGFDTRSNSLKKKLSAIITQKHSSPEARKQKVLEALTTTTDEMRIAYNILRMGYPLEFRDKKGPDFRIGGRETKMLEAKSRFNRKYVGEISNKSARLNEKGIFSLLCRDGFSLVEKAFEEQNTSIALVNLSHSEYGLLLAMHSLLNDRKFNLKKALDNALKMSTEGKEAAVLYVESSGGTSDYFGIALERRVVRKIGRSLDKIENILRNKGIMFDFYDLAFVAQNPNEWFQKVKESSGINAAKGKKVKKSRDVPSQ